MNAQWISINERLPEEGILVLVWFCGRGHEKITIDSIVPRESRFSDVPCWGHHSWNNVTHWMPLPEPPKIRYE